MTPRPVNRDSVARRLRQLADALDDLRSVGSVTADRLRAERVTRAAVERLLQVTIDSAVDINAHLTTARRGRAPETGRESFLAMAEIGALGDDLAHRLAPSASMRNVLVHRYVDIDVQIVADVVAEALDSYDAYVRAVSAYVAGLAD